MFGLFLERVAPTTMISRIWLPAYRFSTEIQGGTETVGGKRQKKPFKDGNFGPKKVQLLQRVLHVRRVARVNSGGKIRTVSALVVVGDQNGSAGYGMGRGSDISTAVQKAATKAEKNMQYFLRLDNRTIHSDIDYKFHRVNYKFRSARPGIFKFTRIWCSCQ